MTEPKKTVMVSGGFDPIHSGHVRMILDAATYGDVVVVANSDDWLIRKKGYFFMDWQERSEILASIKGVSSVTFVDDSDGTVCEAISRVVPDFFANGGDRKSENTPEMDLCNSLGVNLLWDIGGGKIQSSSNLVDRHRKILSNNKK
tara:strand:- start:355 stop:792 length:438 start_codon:yes stop_codon:yes gene_type:complete